MEIINFSADLEASESRRIIAGKIVPFGDEIGNTSAGKVIFESGSIAIDDPKQVKLLLEHDPKQPIGRMKNVSEDNSGIYAEFKVSNTTRGTDSLIEASENLRSGLSVGVEVIKGKNKNGVYHVSAARLMEVSLVQAAAFKSAEVTSVAASENSDAVSTETKTETEEIVENTTPETVATEVVETPAVEASRPTVTAAVYSTPRVAPIANSAEYLELSVKAAMGDDDAKHTIKAATSTSTVTGLTLPQHLQEFITSTIADRPAVDAISRGVLPSSGMSFTIPKMTQAPSVTLEAEAGALGGDEMTANYLTVDVKKAASIQTISWELIDRSSPVFYSELISELSKAYAKYTDTAVLTAFSGGTDATPVAATQEGLQAYVAESTAAAYKSTGSFARNLVASPEAWAAIMGFADTSKRPIYIASQPQNAGGAVSPQSIRGNVLGLDLYVSSNFSTTTYDDDSMFIVEPNSATFYESPTTTLQVQALANGQLQVAIYGYYAIALKKSGGIRTFKKV
jgi:HK97 family phage major capsid protein